MIRAAAFLLGLAVAVPVPAAQIVWRSSSSGVLHSPVTPMPTLPLPPESPAAFVLSIDGEASVMPGAILDLRPVVSGASGSFVSFLLFGKLPLGATFNSDTGRIAGHGLKSGTYQVWLSATDSTGATVSAPTLIGANIVRTGACDLWPSVPGRLR